MVRAGYTHAHYSTHFRPRRPRRLDIRAFDCPNFVMGRRHWLLRYDLLVIMIYRQAKNPSVCLCAQRMFTAFST